MIIITIAVSAAAKTGPCARSAISCPIIAPDRITADMSEIPAAPAKIPPP